MRCILLSCLFLAATWTEGSALAGPPSLCIPARVLAADAEIPADVPAIPFGRPFASPCPTVKVGELPPPVLSDARGATVPAKLRGAGGGHLVLLEPDAPLTPGETYTLAYGDVACASEQRCGGAATGSRTLRVGPPRGLPRTVGTFVHRGSSVVDQRGFGASDSVDRVRVVREEVSFEPSEELRPYLAAARIYATFDGQAPNAYYVYDRHEAEEYGALRDEAARTLSVAWACGATSGPPPRIVFHAEVGGREVGEVPMTRTTTAPCASTGEIGPGGRGGCSVAGPRGPLGLGGLGAVAAMFALALRRRGPATRRARGT